MHERLVERVTVRCGEREVRIEMGTALRQRASDVVAVADVGETLSGKVATAFAHGEQVGEGLAGMVEWRQRVDDRDLSAGGELGDPLVRAGADYDRVDVAREHPSGIDGRLAARELHFVAAQDDRMGAQLGDANVEGGPRPGRGLLEDERNAAPGQRIGPEALTTPRL